MAAKPYYTCLGTRYDLQHAELTLPGKPDKVTSEARTGETLNMNSRTILIAFGAAAFLALSATAQAQAYKWKDANGRIVYSDQPPPRGTPAANILKAPKGFAAPSATEPPTGAATTANTASAKPAAAATPAAAPKAPMTIAEREADFRKRQAESQKKAQEEEKKASDESQRQAQCNSLRQNLATLESGQRIARTDSNGERIFIDDAERARDIQKARQDLAAGKC